MCSCGTNTAKSGGGSKTPATATTASCPAGSTTSPCKGIGLNSDANAKEFVADFKQLQKDWPKLSVAEREQRIEDITNKQLAKSGVPALDVVHEKLPKGNGGHLGKKNWQLVLNEDTLNGATLSDDDAKTLANTAYHESRHGEQWYLMARKKAADGKKADEIRDEMQIPGKIAEAAKKDPLKAGSCEASCAEKMNDSVYGKDKAHRGTTLKGAMSKLNDLNAANKAYQDALADPKASKDQRDAAKKKAEDTRKDYDAVYKDYRDLPEEADAFETGGLVDKNW
jgi:hypothetical protein